MPFGGLFHFLGKEVVPMTSFVTYSDLFAFALVIIGIIALLKSKA